MWFLFLVIIFSGFLKKLLQYSTKPTIIITISAFLLSDSEDVEFCGYTITHPSENKINFRIQTKGKGWLLNL